MPRPSALVPLVLAAALAPAGLAAQSADPHSFARPDVIAVTHLDLDLTVDFDAHRLAGTASLRVERRDPAAEELSLDTQGLEILEVRFDDAPAAVPFRLSDEYPVIGRNLTIPIGETTRVVHIRYRTGPEAAALQWLAPEQTAGGRKPFLFTQSQAILARSWVPCQDTPGVRTTYTATIRTRPDLLALMSAENPTARTADGVYRFEMKQPVPSYLLALAVGDLEFRPLGKRSGVYAEPAVVDGAAWELADTESMIAAAEALYGPYRWGRYDLLVLPPSFPYGGMENPRLTFATPTILAGDKSLVALVAHELAHSWSGNLVTNATWNDFWLNEGFTSYFENRIMEAVFGSEHAAMLRQLARTGLEQTIAELGPESRDTWLYLDLTGRNPDDAANAIAYDKGALMLFTLEEVAGRKRFDAFLRRYFNDHAFRSLTSREFVDLLRERLLAELPGTAPAFDADAWVYGPGIPAGAAATSTAAFTSVEAELARFLAGAPAAQLDTAGWVSQQWQHFLEKLPSNLALERMAELDAAFGFTRSGNSEIQSAWFLRTLPAGYAAADPALESFLLRVGRRKFLRPLYTELARTEAGRARALAIYDRARPGYHPVSQAAVDAILGWKAGGR